MNLDEQTIREVVKLAQQAWRLLRDEPKPAVNEGAGIPLSELRSLVELCLAGCGLPRQWAGEASSEELQRLVDAANIAAAVREWEWTHLERGRWPAPVAVDGDDG